MDNITTKEIWGILKKKKSERTKWETIVLEDWRDQGFCAPIRIIIFPIALIVKLYKWTYNL